jgi:WD40 repeat protein
MGLLFSGGDIGCSSIYVWDISTWTVRSKLNYHSAAISSITGIPNTDYIFSCSLDKTLKLYNYQTSLITSCHKSPYSYMKAVYYEQEQIVAVMTPGVNVDLFFVELGGEEYRLLERKGIVCGGRIGIMEKGGCGGSDLLVVGLYAAGI